MMADNKRTKGPYICWQNYGCEGWQPESFPTLKEAVMAQKFNSEWIVTKAAEFEITEGIEMSLSEDDPQAPAFPMLKEIPVQILNLKDGDCLILRLPPQAFVEMTDSGRTGASELEREFMNWFKYKNKEIKVTALPFSVELAIIEGNSNGYD